MSFKDKVAIVTGAGSGIGFEICKSLASEGARVILNDIDPQLAGNAAAKISEVTSGNCVAYSGDSGDVSFVQQMVAKVVEDYGRLDIAIANAGITLYGDFLSYPQERFFRLLQVNLGGSFFLAQASANQMKNQKEGGKLLFTSSVTGHQAHKNLVVYGMSKAALEMLAKGLVVELSAHKINVNAIAPGPTLTERTLREDPDYEQIWSRLTPIGRPATVQDIAEAALFLVSDKARYITGQTLVVDGGWSSVSPSPYDK
ncbi:MAG: SDR family oxidoreductase [Chitinophagaceae bacterium]|nr:SDR family oxidoreductase [Chitinophagaceae bacterium]